MTRHTERWTTLFKPMLCGVALLGGLAACNGAGDTKTLMAEARQYQQKGETRAAIIQLKNALQKEPDNARARALLGSVYLDAGDALSAEKELRKALALGMARSELLPALGKALLMLGQFDKLLAEIKPDPGAANQLELMALRANAHLAMGEREQARLAFEELLKQQADFGEALLGLARIVAGAGQLDQAMTLLERVLGKNPVDIDALQLKGDLLRMQGQTDAARLTYGKILTLRPNHTQARIDLANLLMQAGKMADARAQIEAARKNAPASLPVAHALAVLDFREGKNKAALEGLQRILKAAPEHLPSVLLMGAVQLAMGSTQQAEQYLQKFLESNPQHLYARKLLASVALAKGQPEEAIAIAEPLLQAAPDNVELLTLTGEAHMRARHYARAAEYFQKASERAPDAAALHTALGMSQLGMGEQTRAIAELERATLLDAKNIRPGIMLIMTHLRSHDYDKAMAAVTAMEAQQPANPLVHNLKGSVLVAKKDLTAARASFEHALSLDGAYLPALDNLAQLDLADKKPEQAKRRFEAALSKDKKNIGLMTALARFAMAQNDKAEATRWFEQASRENPESLPSAITLGRFYLRAGASQKALVVARKLQAANPAHPDILALLAQAQYDSGERAAASDSYAKLAVLQPASAPLQLRIAAVQMGLNDQPGALQAVKKALHLQPGLLEAQVLEVALLTAKGNYTEARTVAQDVQRKRGDLAAGFKLEGDVWMAQNNPVSALKLYEQAFSKSKVGPLLVKIHQALLLAGKPAEADTRVTGWLREHPGDIPTRLYLAASNLSQKQFHSAIAQYETVLQQEPQNVMALNDLAWLYMQVKDKRALATAERAHQLAADNPAVLDTLAWILLGQGEAARALPLLRKAATLAPDAAEIGYHLGAGLARTGDKRAARTELERVLASNREFASRAEARALLAQL